MLAAEDRYDSLIAYYAGLHNRDARQVKRQIRAESNFNPTAASPVGARGLLQFMPATWLQIAWPGDDIVNPEHSIRAGCKYMATLQGVVNGDLALALAAYNWGIGHVRKVQADPNWRTLLPPETAAYVMKCMDYEGETVAGWTPA